MAIEQQSSSTPDIPSLPDTIVQSNAEELIDTIRNHVSSAMETGAAIVRIGEYDVPYDAFEAIHRDPDTQKTWTYKRRPLIGRTSWTVSCESTEPDSRETVRVVARTPDHSHPPPSVEYSRVEGNFVVAEQAKNTEQAVAASARLLGRLPTP